ncbi:hypothetical protein BV25DRAFT_990771 [Artomyces pyxidatus]|uniref:Uncharacterized protein n=1 Tax=Artomyces pyxidatus TaxID=48021 RepID=A0ACB8SWH4_9AGAM|nr:hypothetical protein BV25DRAFT_990771 [Artomyces pyxidatus]
MVIRRSDVSAASFLPPPPPPPAPMRPRASPASDSSMPPPPSLPSRYQDPARHALRGRQTSRAESSVGGVRMARTRSPRRDAPPAHSFSVEDAENENLSEVVALPRRPLPRKFGIFCTGANSAYGTGRPRIPRSPRNS